MKKCKLKLLCLLVVLINVAVLYGQDPQFSQFYAAPLYMGPSFAGSNGETRLILNYRDQWPKMTGNYVTYALSVDHFLSKYNSGVGLLLFRDEEAGGLVNTNDIGVNYNYSFNVSRKWKLSPGIQVYNYSRKINYNKLVFSDQISRDNISSVSVEKERLATLKQVNHLDVTTSLLAYSDKIWAGFTFDHMLSMNHSFKDEDKYVPLCLSLYGGGKYFLSSRMRSKKEESITGAFNFMCQGSYKYLDLGAYYTKSPMQFGLWYRGIPVFSDNPNVGAITLQFGYRYNNVVFGYSYDYTMSKLMARTGGAHEVSFAVDMKTDSRRKRMRMVPCPII